MASIDKRPNGTWRARWRETPGGPQRTKTFTRKVDAERFLTKVRHDLMTGHYVDPSTTSVTLGQYAERWLERMRPTWAPSTATIVETSLRRHVLPVLGRRSLAALRRADLEALYASLPLAPGTVRKTHQHLSQMLSGAVEDGLRANNPASRAKLPRHATTRAQPVPIEVAERIEAELPEWLRVAVPLALGGGLRQSEAAGLLIGRVDFLRRSLRVDRQLGAAGTLLPPKTPSGHRTIPLGDPDLEALAVHLQRHPGEPGDLLLRTPTGGAVTSDRFGWHWRRARAAAGAPTVRYHDLRHTFASQLLSERVSVRAVARWLGHSDPSTTLRVYAHVMPDDEEVARQVLNRVRAHPAEDSLRTGEPYVTE